MEFNVSRRTVAPEYEVKFEWSRATANPSPKDDHEWVEVLRRPPETWSPAEVAHWARQPRERGGADLGVNLAERLQENAIDGYLLLMYGSGGGGGGGGGGSGDVASELRQAVEQLRTLQDRILYGDVVLPPPRELLEQPLGPLGGGAAAWSRPLPRRRTASAISAVELAAAVTAVGGLVEVLLALLVLVLLMLVLVPILVLEEERVGDMWPAVLPKRRLKVLRLEGLGGLSRYDQARQAAAAAAAATVAATSPAAALPPPPPMLPQERLSVVEAQGRRLREEMASSGQREAVDELAKVPLQQALRRAAAVAVAGPEAGGGGMSSVWRPGLSAEARALLAEADRREAEGEDPWVYDDADGDGSSDNDNCGGRDAGGGGCSSRRGRRRRPAGGVLQRLVGLAPGGGIRHPGSHAAHPPLPGPDPWRTADKEAVALVLARGSSTPVHHTLKSKLAQDAVRHMYGIPPSAMAKAAAAAAASQVESALPFYPPTSLLTNHRAAVHEIELRRQMGLPVTADLVAARSVATPKAPRLVVRHPRQTLLLPSPAPLPPPPPAGPDTPVGGRDRPFSAPPLPSPAPPGVPPARIVQFANIGIGSYSLADSGHRSDSGQRLAPPEARVRGIGADSDLRRAIAARAAAAAVTAAAAAKQGPEAAAGVWLAVPKVPWVGRSTSATRAHGMVRVGTELEGQWGDPELQRSVREVLSYLDGRWIPPGGRGAGAGSNGGGNGGKHRPHSRGSRQQQQQQRQRQHNYQFQNGELVYTGRRPPFETVFPPPYEVPPSKSRPMGCNNAYSKADAERLAGAVSSEGPRGSSELHWAAGRGDALRVAELLIKTREDAAKKAVESAAATAAAAMALVNCRNRAGETPLHRAAQCRQGRSAVAVLELLLSAGADPNAADCWGVTPLMRVFAAGCWLPEGDLRCEVLLSAGARVDVREANTGETLLHKAIIYNVCREHQQSPPRRTRSPSGHRSPCRVRQQPLPTANRHGGITAAAAAGAGTTSLRELLQLLLSLSREHLPPYQEDGENDDDDDDKGASRRGVARAAAAAATAAAEDAVASSAGRSRGLHVDARDARGRTALHVACSRPHLHGPGMEGCCVTVLLREGADPNAADDMGRRPLHIVLAEAAATTRLHEANRINHTKLAVSRPKQHSVWEGGGRATRLSKLVGLLNRYSDTAAKVEEAVGEKAGRKARRGGGGVGVGGLRRGAAKAADKPGLGGGAGPKTLRQLYRERFGESSGDEDGREGEEEEPSQHQVVQAYLAAMRSGLPHKDGTGGGTAAAAATTVTALDKQANAATQHQDHQPAPKPGSGLDPDSAATRIQAAFRGHRARRRLKAAGVAAPASVPEPTPPPPPPSRHTMAHGLRTAAAATSQYGPYGSEHERAAIRIQAAHRGYLVRKHLSAVKRQQRQDQQVPPAGDAAVSVATPVAAAAPDGRLIAARSHATAADAAADALWDPPRSSATAAPGMSYDVRHELAAARIQAAWKGMQARRLYSRVRQAAVEQDDLDLILDPEEVAALSRNVSGAARYPRGGSISRRRRLPPGEAGEASALLQGCGDVADRANGDTGGHDAAATVAVVAAAGAAAGGDGTGRYGNLVVTSDDEDLNDGAPSVEGWSDASEALGRGWEAPEAPSPSRIPVAASFRRNTSRAVDGGPGAAIAADATTTTGVYSGGGGGGGVGGASMRRRGPGGTTVVPQLAVADDGRVVGDPSDLDLLDLVSEGEADAGGEGDEGDDHSLPSGVVIRHVEGSENDGRGGGGFGVVQHHHGGDDEGSLKGVGSEGSVF
ncbi:hypothetical protein VOLCADRAFT_94742 [Volvox carteri f. nagariensis]|uniref:Uncharacterized protein n=1 Tax=Volvox carteri f. nagariensis TaxID=3068 RepID=D8U5M2_VOLCA|nr:uncharacterized protein VOLCADRAFT_94742 [Volvox carteri f. nagariensis]EFJ44942.1 hypothetical protein VOLCADRAFT_94742 [Volvox carteri f. nagariensis]|eukprot:XP_002953913.1 hypothetical protein VOLCADRAFT_94742 [Volvox carteri f. nagariensis]